MISANLGSHVAQGIPVSALGALILELAVIKSLVFYKYFRDQNLGSHTCRANKCFTH